MSIPYLHLKRAIEKNNECFFCDLETEIEQKYLNNYLQELVMDTKAREKLVQSRGFCYNHSYKILIEASKPTSSDGHGIALIMQSVTAQLIQDISEQKGRKSDFSKLWVNDKKCPACVHVSDFMKMYVEKATEFIASSDDFMKLFKESKGLCVQHFVTLTYAIETMETNERLRILPILNEVERKNLQRLNGELAEYVRRQSYEFSEKDRAAVANVLLRSIEKIAGKRGIKMVTEQHGVM